jgi:rhodanese-related sulfurtransferase
MTKEDLVRAAIRVAVRPALWRPFLNHDPASRWHVRLTRDAEHEVWLLGWTAEQGVEMHDHGGSAGAFMVVQGQLVEDHVDDLLTSARARLKRVDPVRAAAALGAGGLLVDIRASEVRSHDGEIPGAVVIDRNVLEWRLDPASPHRLRQVETYDQTIILVCTEGYASSLAAATLQDLGLRNATDLDGGFRAWEAHGLPVKRKEKS